MALIPDVLNPLQLIDVAARFKHIKLTPRMPNFAAWVDEVDLTKPLSDAQKKELRQALWDFEVLFFRPQKITPEQHVALAAVFGEVAPGSYFERLAANPSVETIIFDEKRPPYIDAWHTDVTYSKNPPAGTVIQITELPPCGGNTCWASTSKAYAALSAGLKAYFQDLRALHTWEITGFREVLGKRGEEAVLDAMRKQPPVSHRLVITHPESGKRSLYFNTQAIRRIEQIDYRESMAMLDFLNRWIQRPEFMVHHQWEAHGVAVWDNRTTQHYALADYWPYRRVNQRVTFRGALDASGDAAKSPDRAVALGLAK